MTEIHVVVGAGSVGSIVASRLAEAGHEVRVVTRSGSGPQHPRVERVQADAADPGRLSQLSAGAVAVYNTANPPYHRWPTDWPPLAASLLSAARSSGAVLATLSNVYAYGEVDGPMTEDLPLAATDSKGRVRARMWDDALAAHRAGDVRVVEVRASDFADAGAQSHLARNAPAVLAGTRVRVIGSADEPHSWTTVHDTATLLLSAAADPSAHGRAWHVPTAPPRTQREALGDLAAAAGAPRPRISTTGRSTLRVLGLFSPMMRELAGTAYQFGGPFVLDDSAARRHFGLQPQPWDATVARVVERARGR